MWPIFIGIKPKKNFFFEKKFQNGRFSKSPILKKNLWKFNGLVLGLVGLIDANGIDVAQLIWSWDCPTWAQKQAKIAFFVFLGCFWAYVVQPHNHIGWATSMPFTSINSTNPRTNPWNFYRNILFLLHPHENQPKLLGYQGWVEILMITLVYRKRVSVRNNLLHSVFLEGLVEFQNKNSRLLFTIILTF